MGSKVIHKETKVIERVDTNLKMRKCSTKAEFLLQNKKLQETNDALEKSNRQKIEQLESFKEKIDNLEEQMVYFSHKDIMYCKETQTEDVFSLKCEECHFEGGNEREIGWHIGRHHGCPSDEKDGNMDISNDCEGDTNCNVCGFKANTIYDLNAHIETVHSNSSTDDSQKLFSCQFCELRFRNKTDLIKHKKFTHTDKVSACRNFQSGKCIYTSDKCWFQHSEHISEEFQCKFCEQYFPNHSEVLNHRKKHHQNSVPLCRHYSNGSCVYTNETCWFRHAEKTEDVTNNKNQNRCTENEHLDKEVIEKLFKMMENFTVEIRQMKENNK